MSSGVERRAACELRAVGDSKHPRLAGHAAIFNSPSLDLGGFTEVIAPGAFSRTLAAADADPLALVSHLPHLVLGRRSNNTLRLNEDFTGLAFEIDLPNTQTARELMIGVERGDIKGASFAFTVAPNGDHWAVRGDKIIRELRDLDLHEISITPMPAYPDTTVARRMLASLNCAYPALRSARRFLETV